MAFSLTYDSPKTNCYNHAREELDAESLSLFGALDGNKIHTEWLVVSEFQSAKNEYSAKLYKLRDNQSKGILLLPFSYRVRRGAYFHGFRFLDFKEAVDKAVLLVAVPTTKVVVNDMKLDRE